MKHTTGSTISFTPQTGTVTIGRPCYQLLGWALQLTQPGYAELLPVALIDGMPLTQYDYNEAISNQLKWEVEIS